jgi:hypothetical protein
LVRPSWARHGVVEANHVKRTGTVPQHSTRDGSAIEEMFRAGPNRKVLVANDRERAAGDDVFERYRPPFDLEADMLFVTTAVPSGLLASNFPGVPFLRLAGSTPMVLWFSRVRSLCHGPPEQRMKLDESTGFGYDELNFVVLLRGRRLFVPVIYASGGLTQELGHRYGMPKRPVTMSFVARERVVESTAASPGVRGEVRASLLAAGRILALPFAWSTPWWSWPAHFPDGSYIRALIQGVPRAQLASVRGGLDLDVPGFPRLIRLWPVGLFVPGLRMRLPAPK